MQIEKIRTTNMLPFPETYKGCDITNRQEVDLLSGEMIHAFQLKDTLIISNESYAQIKDEIELASIPVNPPADMVDFIIEPKFEFEPSPLSAWSRWFI